MDVDSPYAPFLSFLASANIQLSDKCQLTAYPTMGNGLKAVTDIPAHSELFAVPKVSVLSTQTSDLKNNLPAEEWEGLKGGWGRLILCLMWEQGRGDQSPWAGYLQTMPSEFFTPMFWANNELEELRGTSIFDKIGVEEAENEYTNRLLPIIKAHEDLFPPSKFEDCFSMKWFHIQGSRILSRSFHIEGPKDEEDEDDEFEEDDADNGGEDVDTVGMVPMADMLNAMWGEENAKLFYTETHLTMITTEDISSGAQILNTYARPPNSDLLRRYGHVDVIPPSKVGNEEDEVEIRCDLAVEVAKGFLEQRGLIKENGDKDEWKFEGRVEFWLEEGGDEVIPIQITDILPPPLTAFLTLLLLPTPAYKKAHEANKLPRPKLSLEVAQLGQAVVENRLAEYPSGLDADLTVLADSAPLPIRQRLAVVVRAGEKTVLHASLQRLQEAEKTLSSSSSSEKPTKRKGKGSDSARAGSKMKLT